MKLAWRKEYWYGGDIRFEQTLIYLRDCKEVFPEAADEYEKVDKSLKENWQDVAKKDFGGILRCLAGALREGEGQKELNRLDKQIYMNYRKASQYAHAHPHIEEYWQSERSEIGQPKMPGDAPSFAKTTVFRLLLSIRNFFKWDCEEMSIDFGFGKKESS